MHINNRFKILNIARKIFTSFNCIIAYCVQPIVKGQTFPGPKKGRINWMKKIIDNAKKDKI